jgi:DNA-directed RNA polymerase subunit M
LEFCPKCGKLLIPLKKTGKVYLICRSCGFEKPAGESKGYKILQPVDEKKRRKTVVVEEPIAKGRKKNEEERELMADYYEVFLENFQEEGGEEEGSSEEGEYE